MNIMIKFFWKKKFFIAGLLALIASSVSVFSFAYPVLFRSIIENVETFYILDFRLLGIYAGLLLIGIILQYFGTIFFNKFRLDLYHDFRKTIFSNYFSLDDKEKKKHGVGVFQNRISAELDHAFSILNITTFKSFIFLIRIVFAIYIGFFWNIYIGIIFTTNIAMYIFAAFFLNTINSCF